MLHADLFNDKTSLVDYRSDVWRVVESQEDAATLRVVDDLDEQMVLEQLLDDAKPKYREGTQGMHYLLKTAFRYPPLKWGSRFGTRLMPSYFYASEQASTALCECAYYRFLFLQDMTQPYSEPIRSEYSLFKVLVNTPSCLDLTAPEFHSVREQLTSPTSYAYSQAVGVWAYDRGQSQHAQEELHGESVKAAELIRFESARADSGVNVAVATPSAIRSRKSNVQQKWLCLTKPDSVSFRSRESDVSYMFNLREFCDEGEHFQRVE